ncbi:DNA polymerase I [Lacipirellula sp.]|uniref:DNA polymerase I n=1 Tax=Lacipirellula sp. TaxID=2691419 RepID=UPI003D0E0163
MAKRARQTTFLGMDEPESQPAAKASRASVGVVVNHVASPAEEAPPEGPLTIRDWTIYVVDSYSLIFQVFHAMSGSELTSPRGEPVGAVYGFTRDLVQLMERKQPTALLCAFDLSGPTFRHEMYDSYKADRSEMPEALVSQIPKIREVVQAMGIPVVDYPGFEADDVMATVARLCEEGGARCLLVTADKDCRQLLTSQTAIYNIRKDLEYGGTELYGDWGIAPEQVVDFQSLVGDKIDNVPGVPLIGPKIAKELLEKYGSLENVLDHAGEVGGKRSQNLIEHREAALLSRKLVELDKNVPIAVDWSSARIGGFDEARLADLFRDYGFRGLAERVMAVAGATTAKTPGQLIPAVSDWDGDYQVVDTPEALAVLISQMEQQEQLSIDTETTAISPRIAEVVGYSFAWRPGQAFYVPVRGPEGDRVLDPAETAAALKPIFENPAITKIGQNIKYDIIVLRTLGIELRGVVFDTMVADYLIDSGERTHNLDHLSLKYLGHETIRIGEIIGSGKNQLRMDQASVAAVGEYAAEDADVPLRLMPILVDRLSADNLAELNETIEVPLIDVLADLEYLGVSVDVARLKELSVEYSQRLQQLKIEIEELAGRPLNIDSPKQLAELLFTDLKLPVIKKTKTGASTDASVLEELAPLHPLPAKIVEYRQYSKLLGTYIDALPELVNPATGRVHASLNQVVAATGRLSSSNPNLQNIPIRTREGREIRSAFKAGEPGWVLLAADYSQIELRVLAHYCGDPSLRQAFENDEDIHRLVASQVNGVSMDAVTSEMRRGAKAVNFGIIYGQSPFGLAKGLGISKEEASDFIEKYFATYPGVMDYLIDTLTLCREQGYVTTLFNRRRAIDGVRPVPPGLREKSGTLRFLNVPERTAVNAVIQGTAADLIKVAMIRIQDRLKQEKLPGRMLLQIHDELLFETPPEAAAELATLVRQEMSTVAELAVPLKVDVKIGPNWAACEAWEE